MELWLTTVLFVRRVATLVDSIAEIRAQDTALCDVTFEQVRRRTCYTTYVRFDEIKLKFTQSINLLSSKGPKATHESHQYTIVIVHKVQTMYTICVTSCFGETVYNLRNVQFTVQYQIKVIKWLVDLWKLVKSIVLDGKLFRKLTIRLLKKLFIIRTKKFEKIENDQGPQSLSY